MKRNRLWAGTLGAAGAALLMVTPAAACACAGEAYSPWRDYTMLSVPALVGAVGGWLGYQILKRRSQSES